MLPARALIVLVLSTILVSVGCSRSTEKNEEIAKAQAEAVAAKEEAAKARAEADVAKAALPKPPKAPTGPRVWRDTEAEEFLKWLDIEGECFRFEGGWIAFWLEESDGDGKQAKRGEILMSTKDFPGVGDDEGALAGPQGKASGSAAWIRRSQNKYDWDLAFKSHVKTDGRGHAKALVDQFPKGAKVEKVESSGENNLSFKITREPADGKRPPTPAGKPRLTYGDADVTLKEGQEVTLVTLQTVRENGEVVRTVKLQCKLLK